MSYGQMRRIDKAMSPEKMEEFIKSETIAHLCLNGLNGYPYVVPLNYAYVDGKFILHSAAEGYKIDCLSNDSRICLTISKQHYILTEGRTPCRDFKTPYTSIVAFGRVIMPEGNDKIKHLTDFVRYNMKYDDPPVTTHDVNFMLKTCVMLVEVDHMTGKSNFTEG